MLKAMNKKNIRVKCPQCSKEFEYYSSEFRPFCSAICRQIDLGHWLMESYTVPVEPKEDDIEEIRDTDESEDT